MDHGTSLTSRSSNPSSGSCICIEPSRYRRAPICPRNSWAKIWHDPINSAVTSSFVPLHKVQKAAPMDEKGIGLSHLEMYIDSTLNDDHRIAREAHLEDANCIFSTGQKAPLRCEWIGFIHTCIGTLSCSPFFV